MKKLALVAALLAAAPAFAVETAPAAPLITPGVAAASATEGSVTINGKVIDQTCVINGGKKNIIVELPTVGTSALQDKGQVAGFKTFDIELSGCKAASGSTALTTVYASFNPAAADLDSENAGTLKNRTAGGAKNVNIQLTNSDRSPIVLGATDRGIAAPSGSGPAPTPATSTATAAVAGGAATGTTGYDATVAGTHSVFGESTGLASNNKGTALPTSGSNLSVTLTYGAQYYSVASAKTPATIPGTVPANAGYVTPGDVQAFTTYSIAYR